MDINNSDLLDQIKDLATKDFPHETCGLIVCEKEGSWRVVSLKNHSQSPKESFLISPLDFIEHKNIAAIYHSHPDSSSAPSHADRLYCNELQLNFLIYSIIEDKFSVLTPLEESV